jgi:formylglycine-generating enzyme required for sulfatase activity
VGRADASISTFFLDKYDVTVGRFRQFVNAVVPPGDGEVPHGYVPPAGSGRHTHLNGGLGLLNTATGLPGEPGWLSKDNAYLTPTNTNLTTCEPWATWTPLAGARENLPINCVNWYEAYAFCIWDGGFLPTDAEWEYAISGGSEQREYPWGATPPETDIEYAIHGDWPNCYYPSDVSTCIGVANIAPVGTAKRGASRWGQLDLEGEVENWTLDRYGTFTPCADCALLMDSELEDRGAWGGNFYSRATTLRRGHRYAPTGRALQVGFRCARSPLQPTNPGLPSSSPQPPPAGPPCAKGMVGIPGGPGIRPFCMDVTEVTISAYRECVLDNACSEPDPYLTGPANLSSLACNWKKPSADLHPVNCVDWNQATSYCSWLRKRLPNAEEWEWAAQSGPEGRTYPWGEEPPSGERLNACGLECMRWIKDNLGANASSVEKLPMYSVDDGWPTTAPVGSFPRGATAQGLLDMAGNVFEWTSSGRVSDNTRVVRGGGWSSHPANILLQQWSTASFRYVSVGFRCAQ